MICRLDCLADEAHRGIWGNYVITDGQYMSKGVGAITREGYGTLKDGPESYTGEWANDKMEGKGTNKHHVARLTGAALAPEFGYHGARVAQRNALC